MSQFIMRRGPKPGTIYSFDKDVVMIGSGSKNDIVILDNDVSREHCKLVRVLADYEVHDLNSKHGTFVSGQRLRSPWLLTPGTIIELGDSVTLEYLRGETTEVAQSDMPRQRWSATPSPDSPPPVEAHPFLVLVTGPKPGTIYPLRTGTISLGRDLTNDILIQDPEISRFHLRLRHTDAGYELEDLNSTNGTLINGERVKGKVLLNVEDIVQVGTMVEFRYTLDPDATHAQPAKPDTAPKMATRPLSVPPVGRDTTEINIRHGRSRQQTSRLGRGFDTGELVGHVFITYARDEWESIVVPLTVVLEDAGIRTWVDQYLSQSGDDWMVAIEQALSECWLLVVVVSPLALESRHVSMAYRYFYNREKPIIPFVFRTVPEMPPELRGQQAVKYDIHNLNLSFESVIAAIKQRRKPSE
ncbi:MAG: FHA domain-containing protein [Anaerolineae bacterium]|nr:FHA domain-containing protein [Anaerolineae bacterium]